MKNDFVTNMKERERERRGGVLLVMIRMWNCNGNGWNN